MGLREALGLVRAVEDVATAAVIPLGDGRYSLESGTDAAQVASDPAAAAAFGINTDVDTVDRRTAMTVPAVRRGRQVICGTIGALPLLGLRTNPDGQVEDVTAERGLLTQPDPNVTLQWTLTWTVDDLLFYGLSWWRITDRDPQGFPRQAEWVSRDRIRLDVTAGAVWIDGVRVQDRDLIRFDGPDEGLLVYGGRTLRTAIMLEDAVRRYARLDVPLGLLRLAEGATELSTAPGSGNPADASDTRSQVDVLLDAWEDARARRSTAYINRAIDYEVLQFDAEKTQLTQARQFQAIEIARLLNLAPRWVNAPSADGMTYSNVESERRDLADTSLVGFIAAIEQRLSMGDVTPRGTRVRVDLAQLLRGDTKTALEAAQIAVQLEAMTSAEVRSDVLGRPPIRQPEGPTP